MKKIFNSFVFLFAAVIMFAGFQFPQQNPHFHVVVLIQPHMILLLVVIKFHLLLQRQQTLMSGFVYNSQLQQA